MSGPDIDLAGVRGWGQLAFEATHALTSVVEGMHREIVRPPVVGLRSLGRTRGVTGFVYRSIQGTTRALAAGYAAALTLLEERTTAPDRPRSREGAARAVVNGLAGDHLAATRNPLATRMRLRRGGVALDLTAEGLAQAIPDATPHVVVMLHGLCLSDHSWARNGHDHGAALARDLGATAVYLEYNSGLHISENGRSLSGLLEALVQAWPVPVERLTLVGFSMGGLLARSACHAAERSRSAWLASVREVVFLGTPHHGARAARAMHWTHAALAVSPYTAALALVARAWSVGAADLRHGYLVDEDWARCERGAVRLPRPTPVPLPRHVRAYAVAGRLERAGGLLGDGLVPVASALGDCRDPRRALGIPEERRLVVARDHLGLLGDTRVYERVRSWLAAAG